MAGVQTAMSVATVKTCVIAVPAATTVLTYARTAWRSVPTAQRTRSAKAVTGVSTAPAARETSV